VTQTDGSVIISQGDSVRLNCTYQISGVPYPFWYVQFPNQPPQLFLRDAGREDSDEGIRKGFDAKTGNPPTSFHMWKPFSEVSDSGTYYCAVRHTVTRSSRVAERKPRRGSEGIGVDSGAEGGRGESAEL
uniref:Ig-like domain-containing protein n=1 Tax=Terrapene triunguis TaxID=2587831 RepID=A0A674IY64_9SAUR